MSSCIDIEIRRVGPEFEFSAERKGNSFSFGTKRVGQEFDFKCGLVCSVGSEFYLRVPQEYIWLLPENDFSEDVVVYSNVTWTIE